MLDTLDRAPDRIAASPLYQRLLGSDWRLLSIAVRRAHRGESGAQWSGRLRVHAGGGLLTRIACVLLRLPAAGDGVLTRLTIDATPTTERWTRYFGNTRLVTNLSSDAYGNLVERVKCVELRFQLRVADGSLNYEQVSAGFRFGPLRLPLPRGLCPRVTAREAAVADNRTKISISVSLPIFGLLTSYEGEMEEVRP